MQNNSTWLFFLLFLDLQGMGSHRGQKNNLFREILSGQLPSNIHTGIFTVSDKYTCMPIDVAFVWQNVQVDVFRDLFWGTLGEHMWLSGTLVNFGRWWATVCAEEPIGAFSWETAFRLRVLTKGKEDFPCPPYDSSNHTCTHLVSPTRWRKERSAGFWTNA